MRRLANLLRKVADRIGRRPEHIVQLEGCVWDVNAVLEVMEQVRRRG